MRVVTWILTFSRPVALNRLIGHLNHQGIIPSVFSNHPEVNITGSVHKNIINSLNFPDSNSWCARSWNSIFLQAFNDPETDGVICLQDDTDVGPNFVEWIKNEIPNKDFISAPAGDQFFYISREAVKRVGWWDERYIGCYCGDSDYFKRVYLEYEKTNQLDRISNFDTHNWGWKHNLCGAENHINTEYHSKVCDPDYENQHWQMDKYDKVNKTILHSQSHYRTKWGADLDCGKPAIEVGKEKLIPDIDWYPWASKKFEFSCY